MAGAPWPAAPPSWTGTSAPGGRLWVGDDDYYEDDSDVALAARMPVGLDLTFDKPDFLEVFIELAPALFIVPGVHFDIEAFVGVRFYF